MDKETLKKLLQETDYVFFDDVKDLISNLETFKYYRNELRQALITEDSSFVPNTPPEPVWVEGGHTFEQTGEAPVE
jgi:hypothetical protein